MRLLALGWLAGTAWLQCQAELPAPAAAGIASVTGLLLLLAAIFLRSAGETMSSCSTPACSRHTAHPRQTTLHQHSACLQQTTRTQHTARTQHTTRWWRTVQVLAPVLLLLAGLLSGAGWSAARAHWRLGDALPSALEGRDLQVTGIVASLPDDVGRGQRFRFDVESARDGDTPVHLPITLALGWYDGDGFDAEQRQAVHPGERWQWTVRLKQPHGLANPYGFDEEAWLLSEGVRATGYVRPQGAIRRDAFVFSFRDSVGRAREWLRDRIEQALPSARHAGVIVALVIGDQRGIAERERQLFNVTGIGHLVSISGLHITMIAALAAVAMRWAWRRGSWRRIPLPLQMPAQKAGALAGLFVATVYVALAGFGVPAMRTLLMLAVVTAAQFGARLLPPSRVLAAALLAVMIVDPWALLWPGFWLSFGAIACLLFASAGRVEVREVHDARMLGGERRLVMGAAIGNNMRAAITSAARTQMIVTIGLVPLSAGLFGQLSLVGPFANAVAIPVVSFIVTPLALLGVALPQPLCAWLLVGAHAAFSSLVDVLETMVALFAAIGQGSLTVASNATAMVSTSASTSASASAAGGAPVAWLVPQPDAITLAIAVAGTLWMLAPRGWPWRWVGALCWLPLLLAAPSSPPSGFALTALDIGQGNAVLVETAHHRLLYDTGPAWPSGSDAGSRVILPYLRARGITRLDALVVSHADLDHAGGAASMLAAMPVGWFASSLVASHPLLRGRADHVPCVAGQRWQWDGVWFEVLHPLSADRDERKTNARSCTLRISARDRVALLAGDIEKAQERALLERAGDRLHAQFLLAPHHGSGTSSTAAFLDAVAPDWVLFQVGYRNRYRHPKAEVVERYRQRGIRMQRSDEAGAIRVDVSADDSIDAGTTASATTTTSLDASTKASSIAGPDVRVELRVRAYRCEQRRYWRPAHCAPD